MQEDGVAGQRLPAQYSPSQLLLITLWNLDGKFQPAYSRLEQHLLHLGAGSARLWGKQQNTAFPLQAPLGTWKTNAGAEAGLKSMIHPFLIDWLRTLDDYNFEPAVPNPDMARFLGGTVSVSDMPGESRVCIC